MLFLQIPRSIHHPHIIRIPYQRSSSINNITHYNHPSEYNYLNPNPTNIILHNPTISYPVHLYTHLIRWSLIIVLCMTITNLNYMTDIIVMEIETNLSVCLRCDQDGFLCFSANDYHKVCILTQQNKSMATLKNIIDGLGALSSKAQKLKTIITTSTKFFCSDQRIYIKINDNKALGFIKVG